LLPEGIWLLLPDEGIWLLFPEGIWLLLPDEGI
jgi:hypothetical protein